MGTVIDVDVVTAFGPIVLGALASIAIPIVAIVVVVRWFDRWGKPPIKKP